MPSQNQKNENKSTTQFHYNPSTNYHWKLLLTSDELLISSRRKISLLESKVLMIKLSSWLISAWNAKVSASPIWTSAIAQDRALRAKKDLGLGLGFLPRFLRSKRGRREEREGNLLGIFGFLGASSERLGFGEFWRALSLSQSLSLVFLDGGFLVAFEKTALLDFHKVRHFAV